MCQISRTSNLSYIQTQLPSLDNFTVGVYIHTLAVVMESNPVFCDMYLHMNIHVYNPLHCSSIYVNEMNLRVLSVSNLSHNPLLSYKLYMQHTCMTITLQTTLLLSTIRPRVWHAYYHSSADVSQIEEADPPAVVGLSFCYIVPSLSHLHLLPVL